MKDYRGTHTPRQQSAMPKLINKFDSKIGINRTYSDLKRKELRMLNDDTFQPPQNQPEVTANDSDASQVSSQEPTDVRVVFLSLNNSSPSGLFPKTKKLSIRRYSHQCRRTGK